MKKEQLEKLTINTKIKNFLNSHSSKELMREYKVDKNKDLKCVVTAKELNDKEIRFSVEKNSVGEYNVNLG